MAENSTTSSGIGFTGLLTIVFITLKLVGVEPVSSWSWWWVLSPLWIGFLLAVTFALVAILLALLVWRDRRY